MEHEVQFDSKRKTLPGLEILTFYFDESREIRKEVRTGAAWLSSARALKCSLKWGNERNPRPEFHVSRETARFNWEEGGDDVKSARPSDALGDTHVTMAGTMGLPSRKAELIPSKPVSVRIEGCNSPS